MNASLVRTRRVFALALVVALGGCALRHSPAYVPAGDAQADIVGTYEVKASMLSNSCGGYARQIQASDAEVYPIPQSQAYRLMLDGRAYDFFMQAGGKFESRPEWKLTNAGDTKRTMKGSFKEGRFSLKLTTTQMAMGLCDYIIQVDGRRTLR